MKNPKYNSSQILTLFFVFLFALSSCKKKSQTADFDFKLDCNYHSSWGIYVSFSNNSTKPAIYEWDFGDGSTKSTEENPRHFYNKTGSYKVSLIAKGKDESKTITKTVSIRDRDVSLKLKSVTLDSNGFSRIYNSSQTPNLYIEIGYNLNSHDYTSNTIKNVKLSDFPLKFDDVNFGIDYPIWDTYHIYIWEDNNGIKKMIATVSNGILPIEDCILPYLKFKKSKTFSSINVYNHIFEDVTLEYSFN